MKSTSDGVKAETSSTATPVSRVLPADPVPPTEQEERPVRSDGKPAPQKSLYDSLEQEMASLLGRPAGKN